MSLHTYQLGRGDKDAISQTTLGDERQDVAMPIVGTTTQAGDRCSL